MLLRATAAALALAALATGPPVATEDGITTMDLDPPGAAYSDAGDINDLGQVVGYYHTATEPPKAYLWTAEHGMTDIGAVVGERSEALDLNDLGQIVRQGGAATGGWHAFLWVNGVVTDLGTLGGLVSGAHGVNDLSQVVGSSDPTGGGLWHAFLWEEGVMTDLGTLGGADSWANSINNVGQVAGVIERADGSRHTALWTVPVPEVTPEEAVVQLAEQVAVLVTEGTLDDGEGIALTAKLEAVQLQLDKRNARLAAKLLEAFINQVEAMEWLAAGG